MADSEMTDDDRQTVSPGLHVSESLSSSESHRTASSHSQAFKPRNETMHLLSSKPKTYPHYITFKQLSSPFNLQRFVINEHVTVTRIKRTSQRHLTSDFPLMKSTVDPRQKSTTNVTVSYVNGLNSRNLTTRETKKTLTDYSAVRVTRTTARTNATKRSTRKPTISPTPIVTRVPRTSMLPINTPPFDFNVTVTRIPANYYKLDSS